MIEFQGHNGSKYLVEFRHQRFSRKRLQAVSTCVILGTDRRGANFTAIGTSICVAEDRYARREGRAQAFLEAMRCRLLDADRGALIEAFATRFPAPAPRVPKPKLTPEERAVLEFEGRRRHAEEIGQAGQA